MLKKFLSMVENKVVQVCAHWDADGITSAAIMYHLAKDYADYVFTKTKGIPFLIEPSDIIDSVDVIVCVDIKPSPELLALNKYIIYIDHHPNEDANLFNMVVHDINAQSTSTLIFDKFLQGTKNHYLTFLALLGYFADRGDRYTIPQNMLKEARELIPDYLSQHKSPSLTILDIERYVSLLNAGKRMLWSGDLALDLLKGIEEPELMTEIQHPLAKELQQFREILKYSYTDEIQVQNKGSIDVAVIENAKNIQGVLAAKNLKDKPLLVINTNGELVYGTMMAPINSNIDAGNFLEKFNDRFQSFSGGGHDSIAGMTINKEELNDFLDELM